MQPFATHRHFKDENAGSLNQARGAIEGHRPYLLGESGESAQSRIHSQAGDPGIGKNEMLRKPVFGRRAGYEDLNDAERLRHHPARHWRHGSARRCSRGEPDGPFRDPVAFDWQELVCSDVPFGPMDRRVADTSWRWRI